MDLRTRRPFLLLLALVLLGACHADLDWRELRPAGGGFTVWLPAAPQEQSRPLAGRSDGAVMHQWSARSLETVFAAGYADFERLDRSTLLEVGDALVKNVSGSAGNRRDISLGELRGIETLASGQAGAAPLSLRVRVYARGNRLYQVAVLGKPGAVTEQDLETFFGSFRIVDGPR